MISRRAFFIEQINKIPAFIIGEPDPATVQLSSYILKCGVIIFYCKHYSFCLLEISTVGKTYGNYLRRNGIYYQLEISEVPEPGCRIILIPFNLLHFTAATGIPLH